MRDPGNEVARIVGCCQKSRKCWMLGGTWISSLNSLQWVDNVTNNYSHWYVNSTFSLLPVRLCSMHSIVIKLRQCVKHSNIFTLVMTIQAKHSATKSQMTSQIPNCPLSWIRHHEPANFNSPSWISKSFKNKSEHQKIKKNWWREEM